MCACTNYFINNNNNNNNINNDDDDDDDDDNVDLTSCGVSIDIICWSSSLK